MKADNRKNLFRKLDFQNQFVIIIFLSSITINQIMKEKLFKILSINNKIYTNIMNKKFLLKIKKI